MAWPRVRAGLGNEVRFQVAIDGGPSNMTLPLIFVDNAAAHSPETMQALVKWYMALDPTSGLRTAEHNGAARAYAPESTPGNTTFETKRWLMGARGRLDRPEPDSYRMDAIMEGADQPPFYPFTVLSQMMIRSLQRFTGRTTSWIAASFDDGYARNGFSSKNPAELYLNVHGYGGDDGKGAFSGDLTPVALELGAAGNRSGGVAKPSAQVVALSRQKGPVGGTQAAPPPKNLLQARDGAVPMPPRLAVQAVTATPSSSSPLSVSPDYWQNPATSATSAAQGRFDPVEFFGGATGTILGLIPIKDVIKAALFATAPELLEKLNSAASTIDGQLQAKISALGHAFSGVADDLEATLLGLNQQIQQQIGSNTVSLRALYPNLDSAIYSLILQLRVVSKEASNPANLNLNQFLSDAVSCISSGKQTITALEQIAANPAPAVLQELLKWVTGLRDPLALLIPDYQTRLQSLGEQARFAINSDICQTVNGRVWQLGVFGDGKTLIGDREPLDACGVDWTNHQDVQKYLSGLAASAGEALFYEVLSKPVLDLCAAAYEFGQDLQGAASQSIVRLTDRALTVINSFFNAVDSASVGPRLYADYLSDQCQNGLKFLTHAAYGVDVALAADEGVLSTSIAKAQATLADLAAVETAALQRATLWTETVDKLHKEAATALPSLHQSTQDAVNNALKSLQRASASLQAVGATVTQTRLGAAAGLKRLTSAIDEFARQRKQLKENAASLPSVCQSPKLLMDTFAAGCRVMSLRLRTVVEAQAFCSRIMEPLSAANIFQPPAHPPAIIAGRPPILDALAQAADRLQQDLVPTLKALFADSNALINSGGQLLRDLSSLRLAGTAGADGSIGFTKAVKQDSKAIQYAIDRVDEFNRSAKSLSNSISADLTRLANLAPVMGPDTLAKAIAVYQSLGPTIASIVSFSGQNERALVGLVSQTACMVSEFPTALAQKLVDALKYLVGILAKIYETVLGPDGLSNPALAPLDDSSSAFSVALRLLLGDSQADLFKLSDLMQPLRQDQAILNKLSLALTSGADPIQQLGKAAPYIATLRSQITSQQLGVTVVAEKCAKLVDTIGHGRLASLSEFTNRFIEVIKQFIYSELPFTSTCVGYSLGTALRNIEPFFYMENSTDEDLTLNFKATINLIDLNDRHTEVSGCLQPFRVDIVEVVTLHFDAVNFTAQDGQKPALNLKVNRVELGSAAQFIQALESWLSPGGGFYIHPQPYPPGIIAGFAIDCGTIGLGEVSFLNVSLGASVELPFDDRPALFSANVSRRESPFLISIFPFGGGGFLSIISDAHSIVGFEASFEYGAVVAFGFGPLYGQGMVTSGIYIARYQETARLSGFFLASGSAHLACFGVSASLMLSIEQNADGNLHGNATFTFSFSMGFLDVSYDVGVTRQISKGWSSSNSLLAKRSPTLEIPRDDLVLVAFQDPGPQNQALPVITTNSKSMGTNWPAYEAYFDATL